MAYASTVAITRRGNVYRVLITETDVGTTDVATVEIGIQVGTVMGGALDFASGDGADATPTLHTVSGGNNGTEFVCALLRTTDGNTSRVTGSGGAAAAQGDWPCRFYSADGKLFHQGNPASGSNNVMTTEYLIKAGW